MMMVAGWLGMSILGVQASASDTLRAKLVMADRFKTIPLPGQALPLQNIRLNPETVDLENGKVLFFQDVPVEDWKSADLFIQIQGGKIATTVMETKGAKPSKMLRKKLPELFGSPLSLDRNPNRDVLTWQPTHDQPYEITLMRERKTERCVLVVKMN